MKFKTRISVKAIILGVIGITAGLFFLLMTFQVPMISNVTQHSTSLLIRGIRAIFILFTVYPLSSILNLKIIYLTETSLILRKPMLFSSKEILFSEIIKTERKEYKVAVADKSVFSKANHIVYKGEQIIFWLKNGKSIKLISFEMRDYKALLSKFYMQYNHAQKTV